jgi:hypothetical protein
MCGHLHAKFSGNQDAECTWSPPKVFLPLVFMDAERRSRDVTGVMNGP